MMGLKCLAVFASLLLPWTCELAGGERPEGFLSATEQELLKSQLWKRNIANLFIVRQSEQGPCVGAVMSIVLYLCRCKPHPR